MGNNKRKFYFDYLRILATLAVITIHVTAEPWLLTDINSSDWFSLNLFSAAVRWAVPMFVMISGALFLNPQKEVITKNIFTKNILRIVTAFIFWSVFYAIINYTSPTDFISAVLEGHYHLWFCFLIVGLYIIIPVLRQITKSSKTTRYFLIVAFFFTFLIPDIIRELQQQIYSDLLLGLGNSLGDMFENSSFHFTLGYTAYFILGFYLSATEMSKKVRIFTYILGIYGIIATIFYTYLISTYQQTTRVNYFEANTTNMLFSTIGIFCFAKYELGKIKIGEKMQLLIKTVSKYSFGIYLVHPFVIAILEICNLSSLSFHPILAVPMMIILTFIGSLTISALLNNIPFVKKYIV